MQLMTTTLLTMHLCAITETEMRAGALRQRLRRDVIDDQLARDRDINDAHHASSSADSACEVEHRGYRSARSRDAETVVHRRVMSYAKYYDRKNSDRESLTERDPTILSMSPALRPMKEST
jgi:hypothetical protein